MTTFKINQPAHPLHGREFPEYTEFRRYHWLVSWIPLLVGENQVKFFALCNLCEVRSPFDSGLVYDKPELPPRSIVVYKPLTLYVTPDLLPGIDRDKSSGVEIRIAA